MRSVDNDDDGGGREHVAGSMTDAPAGVNACGGREIEVGKTGILAAQAELGIWATSAQGIDLCEERTLKVILGFAEGSKNVHGDECGVLFERHY